MAQETIDAPLTGKIIKVLVKPGDKIQEDDAIVVLESMKMENPIVSPVGGTVTTISVNVDQVVKTGDIIAVIEY